MERESQENACGQRDLMMMVMIFKIHNIYVKRNIFPNPSMFICVTLRNYPRTSGKNWFGFFI